ncbi:hypothetical protein OVN20_06225 [Microcella daejeonensis]|uniref:hypothetical protein n=1 Tax=Microcella daejeonensis TaxID=2994971 RepID=UPI002270FBB7|nr:hypothetical protein [Microcella daejeonensis]WAB85141.1 hypothetical protein OVN20_06225 [Microcella daejeonensis]
MDDDPRELRDDGFDDDLLEELESANRFERRRRVMKWVSIATMVAMVVPGVLTTVGIAQSTAARSCRLAVDLAASERTTARAAFEFSSLDTLGWNCYAVTASGEVRVAMLGLIPGPPRLTPSVAS